MSTIYDVAERAGVSASTVSRVFGNSNRISGATQDRVRQAAQELAYEPANRANGASAGATRKGTGLVGVVLPDVQSPYWGVMARGVLDGLARRGVHGIVCNSDREPQRERALSEELRERGVDGIIISPLQMRVPQRENPAASALLEHNVPTVFIGNLTNNADLDYVTSDPQSGIILGIDHLVELGHERIALIGGKHTQGIAVGRWLGYQEALVNNGLPIRADYMVETDLLIAGGEAAMRQLWQLPTPPTAVVAVNDLSALGAVRFCRTQGLNVPGQMSVIGFNNVPWTELVTPALTTVAQPAYEVGASAAALLHQRIQQPNLSPQHRILDCRLVVRDTTGSPSSTP